jgi:hypothetical protein
MNLKSVLGDTFIAFTVDGRIVIVKGGDLGMSKSVESLPPEADDVASVTAKMQAILQNL